MLFSQKTIKRAFSVCLSTAGFKPPRPRKKIAFLASPAHRLVYIYVPKAACTSLKSFICDIEPSIDLNLSRYAAPETLNGQFIPYVRRLSAAELRRQYAGWNIFSFVRNPFWRLVSCYQDKIAGQFYEELSRTGFHKDMTFHEFIDHVCEVPDWLCDEHLAAQTYLLSDARGRLLTNFLGHVESLSEDFPRLLEAANLSYELRHYRKQKQEKLNIPDDRIAMIVNRYHRDFELFGYPKQP
ncbi:MAG: sulfotransferase family protein [Lentisphaeria bacterium]|nr:sulfotransferase family protein [Lentisphaeria bacterium]